MDVEPTAQAKPTPKATATTVEQPTTVSVEELGEYKDVTVAYCSIARANMVYVKHASTEKVTEFQGPKVASPWYALVHQISGSHNLITSNSPVISADTPAKFEVRNYKKDMKYIFHYETTGQGHILDIAHNKKSDTVGLLSVKGSVAYHVFRCSDWSLLKRAAVQPEQTEVITGLSFDSTGSYTATIDFGNSCVITSGDSDTAVFKRKFEGETSTFNKVRWNPVESKLAVTYARVYCNIIDPEKNATVWEQGKMVHDNFHCYLDWHPEGKLFAGSSYDKSVRVFDVNSQKVIKTFDNIHKTWVRSVKWSEDGKLLASCDDHGYAVVTEFATGRQLLKSKIPIQNDWAMDVTFLSD